MEVFLSNRVLIYIFSESVLFVLFIIAVIGSISIIKGWDFNSSTSKQYALEKRAYLIILIIIFSLVFKIALMPYFAYTIDSLKALVPGAMCATGVLESGDFGKELLFLKLVILFFIGIWLIINHKDLQATNYPYLKAKFWFFIFIFLLLGFEFVLDIVYFSTINIQKSAKCCSAIFGVLGDDTLPFGLNIYMLLTLFYLLFILNLVLSFQKRYLLLAISSFAFLYISYQTIIHFFGTYIYQLPTHRCPFCMLQTEYFYIGYLLWATLFLGVFFGISNLILKILIKKEILNLYRYSQVFNTIFVILCSLYPLIYFIKNGVFL